MNREPLAINEYYHVFNHGVETRNIVSDPDDSERFLDCLRFFNSIEAVGSLYSLNFDKDKSKSVKNELVEIICYCLNLNHYHFVLKQLVENGIGEFMRRINGGYTQFFNNKYKRKGALFRGRYKSKHIPDNDYLLHTSAYVNLNDQVHQLSSSTAKSPLVRSSWEEYQNGQVGICKKEVILGQFKNLKEYETFALSSLELSLERKKEEKEFKALLIE